MNREDSGPKVVRYGEMYKKIRVIRLKSYVATNKCNKAIKQEKIFDGRTAKVEPDYFL